MRFLTVLVLLATLALPGPVYAQCKSDSDCKGERICDNGKCVDPVKNCTKDSDCEGNRVCQNSKCVEPKIDTKQGIAGNKVPDKDEVLKTVNATFYRGIEGVSGKMLITKKKILFTSQALNIQGGGPEILISDIKKIVKTARVGFIPTGMMIITKDETKYSFTVNDRDSLVQFLDGLRSE